MGKNRIFFYTDFFDVTQMIQRGYIIYVWALNGDFFNQIYVLIEGKNRFAIPEKSRKKQRVIACFPS